MNPLDYEQVYESYPYSSYKMYLYSADQMFIKTKPILDLFKDQKYSDFVEEYADLFKKRPKDSNLAFNISGLS